ncbi:MAG: phosphatidate cytidylyltransferase [Candidatus Aminicenantales bacterium]
MDVLKRTYTALVLIVLVFICIHFLPSFWFFLFLQLLVLAALMEFYSLSFKKKISPQRAFGFLSAFLIGLSFYFKAMTLELALFLCLLSASLYFLIAFNSREKIPQFTSSIAVTIFGALYLGFTLNFFYFIREEWGRFYVYFLLAVVFLGDTGAYFIGKFLGRHKQVPAASPNKTWEGSAAGFIFAALGAFATQRLFLPGIILWKALLCGLLVHGVAQISDPLESLFKRAAEVKDSSRLLPGHGGFLDRIDSLILAAPFFYFFIRFFW